MTTPRPRDKRLHYAVERGYITKEMHASADYVRLLITTASRSPWSRRKLASLKAYVGPKLWVIVEAAATEGLLTAGTYLGMDISKATNHCRGGLDLVGAWRLDWVRWGLHELERKYPDQYIQPVSHLSLW